MIFERKFGAMTHWPLRELMRRSMVLQLCRCLCTHPIYHDLQHLQCTRPPTLHQRVCTGFDAFILHSSPKLPGFKLLSVHSSWNIPRSKAFPVQSSFRILVFAVFSVHSSFKTQGSVFRTILFNIPTVWQGVYGHSKNNTEPQEARATAPNILPKNDFA